MSGKNAVQRGSGSQSALRAANRRRILDVLARGGPSSQSELSRETGLSGAAVSGLVRELVDLQLVGVRPGQRGGRRVVEVSLTASDHLVLALDAGHRHLRAILADSTGQIVAERHDSRKLTWRIAEDTLVLRQLREDLFDEAGRDVDSLAIAVVGLPVPFGSSGPGRLAREWSDPEVASSLEKALGTSVVLENDANLGALGEATNGAGAGVDDFVYVKLGHGVGAGLVLSGRLYRGGLLAAGEIGHISVDGTGPLCSCGGRGCLELYVGGTALAGSLAHIDGAGQPTLREIVRRCREGEPSYVRAVADAGRQLGFVLANVVNLLAPHRIVLGGELSAVGPILTDATRIGVQDGSARTLGKQVEVTNAQLGARAEVMGAVALGVAELRDRLDLPEASLLGGGEDDGVRAGGQ